MDKKTKENTQRRYRKVLNRCLHDLGYIKAYIALYNQIAAKDNTYLHFNFFYLAATAFFSDIISRSIRLLDKHQDSSNFWYILNIKKKEISDYIKTLSITIADIENLSKKLKPLRDKVHFHIDKDAVLNPKEIWHEAKITGEFLEKVLNGIFEILAHLYELEFSEKYILHKYDGSEINLIYDACQKSGNYKQIFMPCVLHQD